MGDVGGSDSNNIKLVDKTVRALDYLGWHISTYLVGHIDFFVI